jgi:glucokinase
VFDVGGTLLRAAVYDGVKAALVDVVKTDAPNFLRHPGAPWSELRSRLVEELSALRSRLDPDGSIASAVVAFPGPVDAEQRVLAAPTLWGDDGAYPYALSQDLTERWPGTEVSVLNDVAAAGFRYLRGPTDDFCVVAVSTGIGNKVFVGGRPLLGRSGNGGEIGHLQVDDSPDAPACDCGGRGHVGAIASGRATVVRARARSTSSDRAPSGEWTAESLASAYRAADPWVSALIGESADALAFVFAAIHLAIGVDRFVLIGGFALGLGTGFCEDIEAALRSRCWQGTRKSVSVVLGDPDGHCALVGGGRAKHLSLWP